MYLFFNNNTHIYNWYFYILKIYKKYNTYFKYTQPTLRVLGKSLLEEVQMRQSNTYGYYFKSKMSNWY